ncbi:hypothetical protein [Streptomyces sp. NPDC096033]|uniref:hypothetical protein n=1 Tax=Streptomyces sp. NPDC096033 TaxID=3366071 RepID=UPI003830531F
MTFRVRIQPADNAPGTFGANLADIRERAFANAIQSYYNKDRMMSPTSMVSAPVNSQTGRGMFDGLENEVPRRSYSDVV